MDLIGEYTLESYPASRISTFDVCELGRKKHAMKALVEIDVTEARKMLRENKKKGVKLSFTAWLLKCISCVCNEYKLIHGVKKGKRRITVFNDIDISILIERDVQGQKVPLPYVIRKVNEKSISEVFYEIRNVQKQPIEDEGDYVLGSGKKAFFMKLYYLMPGFVRRLFINQIIKSPKSTKKNMGTIVVTSLGMMGRFNGWFIPIGIHPLSIGVGSIVKKPGVINDEVAIREYLYMTILLDHDIIDGAPAARALSRLISLLEKGHGL